MVKPGVWARTRVVLYGKSCIPSVGQMNPTLPSRLHSAPHHTIACHVALCTRNRALSHEITPYRQYHIATHYCSSIARGHPRRFSVPHTSCHILIIQQQATTVPVLADKTTEFHKSGTTVQPYTAQNRHPSSRWIRSKHAYSTVATRQYYLTL